MLKQPYVDTYGTLHMAVMTQPSSLHRVTAG